MTISEQDIKKLWGRAAGRCSMPGCGIDCVPFLDSSDPTVIGEMAHVIAHSPTGPRGEPGGGSDDYENLILLCPNHHSMIDKAPDGRYPSEQILGWKTWHEEQVNRLLVTATFASRKDMAIKIKRLLIANLATWSTYGPDSKEAQSNPLSSLHVLWPFRKLESLVPNNRQIVGIITRNEDLFEPDDLRICARFREHAEGFEQNCYNTIEGVPKFPKEFEEMINVYARME